MQLAPLASRALALSLGTVCMAQAAAQCTIEELFALDVHVDHRFGRSVDLDGDRWAIGSQFNMGAVHLFEHSGTTLAVSPGRYRSTTESLPGNCPALRRHAHATLLPVPLSG